MALRPTRAVKSHQNHGQMSPELRSSVARIAVKCIGIRSLDPSSRTLRSRDPTTGSPSPSRLDQPTCDTHNRRNCSVNRNHHCLKVVDRFRGGSLLQRLRSLISLPVVPIINSQARHTLTENCYAHCGRVFCTLYLPTLARGMRPIQQYSGQQVDRTVAAPHKLFGKGHHPHTSSVYVSVVLCLFAMFIAFPSLAVDVSCEDWNTARFFKHAKLTDVSRCMNAKRLHSRDTSGETPLHSAAASSGAPEVIEFLIGAGADVNARNERGETPLHRAAHANEQLGVISALIVAKSNPNAQDSDGETPLHIAGCLIQIHTSLRL